MHSLHNVQGHETSKIHLQVVLFSWFGALDPFVFALCGMPWKGVICCTLMNRRQRLTKSLLFEPCILRRKDLYICQVHAILHSPSLWQCSKSGCPGWRPGESPRSSRTKSGHYGSNASAHGKDAHAHNGQHPHPVGAPHGDNPYVLKSLQWDCKQNSHPGETLPSTQALRSPTPATSDGEFLHWGRQKFWRKHPIELNTQTII